MHMPFVDGLHGFVLHCACWDLLNKASGPAGLSLERLISACESVPFASWFNGLGWDHGYEGLLKLESEDRYPWMEKLITPSTETMHEMRAFSDPKDASILPTMMLSTKTSVPHFPTITAAKQQQTDPFGRFPWEICEMILANLRTNDALNLRLASPSYLPLFSSISFWLSRFERDSERGFMFEVKEEEEWRNWGAEMLLRIHHNSKRSLITLSSILNRQRIWNLARRLARLIETPLVGDNCSQQQPMFESGQWIGIAGKEQPPFYTVRYGEFQSGCHSTTTIYMNVPPDLNKIGITIINTGGDVIAWDYITGIRFLGCNGEEHVAGYVAKDKELLYSLSELHGLRVAMSSGGIRALQVVNEMQQASKWIGNTEGLPQSDRLVVGAPITSLRFTLDGYKVTGLAVHDNQVKHDDSGSSMSLRRTALWYPSVPPDDLMLNEGSFTGQDPLSTVYQPLCWIHFGGKEGKSLKHVRGLVTQFLNGLHGLGFLYDEAHEKSVYDKIGRSKGGELEDTIFSIDGAGGERIDLVHVGIRRYGHHDEFRFVQHGIVRCLKITTNRGRTTCIGEQADEVEMRPISISEGTIITGFYGHYNPSFALISLGVISEPLVNLV